jgi:hypothetical protein
MHPAELPDVQQATPEYGTIRTLLFFGLYAALILGALAYLIWKLPRHGEEPPDEGP